jgi:hypothetical protein
MPSSEYPNTTSSPITHNNDQQQHEDAWNATLDTQEVDWSSQELDDLTQDFSHCPAIIYDAIAESRYSQQPSDQEDAWTATLETEEADWSSQALDDPNPTFAHSAAISHNVMSENRESQQSSEQEDAWTATLEDEEVDWFSQPLEEPSPDILNSAATVDDVVSESSQLQQLSDQEDAWVAAMDALNVNSDLELEGSLVDICATCHLPITESMLRNEKLYDGLAEAVLEIYTRLDDLIPFIRDPVQHLTRLAERRGSCCLVQSMGVIWKRATRRSGIIWPWTVDATAARPGEQEIILPVIQVAHELGGAEVDA